MPASRVPPASSRAPKATGLTKRIGPLPLWAWGGVLIGGLLLGMMIRKRAGSSSATAAPSAASGDGTGAGGGSVGASQQPASSGLGPDLESLLVAQANGSEVLMGALDSTNQALVGISEYAVGSSQLTSSQILGFSQSIWGSALDFVKTRPGETTYNFYGAGAPGSIPSTAGGPSGPAPVSAPAVPSYGGAGTGAFPGGGGAAVQTLNYAGQPAPPPIQGSVRPASSYIPAAVSHGRGLGGPQQ